MRSEKKLEAFTKYVKSYLTIMKSFPYWKTIYFDGFAGSGNRKNADSELVNQLSILKEEQEIYEGSAERIIKIDEELSFDFYYFIDTHNPSLLNLSTKLSNLQEAQNKKIEFRLGNSNTLLSELTGALKTNKYAALIFLDPFGMQVDWTSISGLSGTRSDIWILVPTGVIVNRLLDRKGDLKNHKKLESFFGLSESDIRSHFYSKHTNLTLFGENESIQKVLHPVGKIADLYVERLKTVWKYVTPRPLRLDNTKGVPIFHLVFASNNENAAKIASQIIKSN